MEPSSLDVPSSGRFGMSLGSKIFTCLGFWGVLRVGGGGFWAFGANSQIWLPGTDFWWKSPWIVSSLAVQVHLLRLGLFKTDRSKDE